jgi:hypothetical protein
MKKQSLFVPLLAVALLPLACSSSNGSGSGGAPGVAEQTGTGTLGISIGSIDPAHDVTQIHFAIVLRDDPCTAQPIAETTVDLQPEPLPPFNPDGGSVLPDGGGANHPFADAFIVVPAGTFNVCATPLTKSGQPSAQCGLAQAQVRVFQDGVTEVLLVSQCITNANGAIDAVDILNDAPVITDLTISPTKFIHQIPCASNQVATLTVDANDPNGDSVSFLWQLLGTGQFATGPMINFQSFNIGDFQLRVTASDPFGRSSSLTVPMHVSACPADAGTDAAPDPGGLIAQ